MRLLLYTCFVMLSLSAAAQPTGVVARFLAPDTTHSQAIDQLRVFPSPLSVSDLNDCLAFLGKRFAHQTDELLIVRQNDLADLLLQEPDTVVRATHVILQVIADESADMLWREYCLQKLPTAYEQDAISESLRVEILEVLRLRSKDPLISFSGTSLLGLYRLRDTAELTSGELIDRAIYILNEPTLATSNKVTALQISALLGDVDALEIARGWVNDNRVAIQLRVSAVATVGQCGDFEDIPALEPLVNHLDVRLRKSSKAAIRRLSTL